MLQPSPATSSRPTLLFSKKGAMENTVVSHILGEDMGGAILADAISNPCEFLCFGGFETASHVVWVGPIATT